MVLIAIKYLGEDAYGREIIRTIGTYTSEPSAAQVCVALKRLRDDGQVQIIPSAKKISRGRPPITYACTEQGERKLADYLTVLDRLREACVGKGVNLNLE